MKQALILLPVSLGMAMLTGCTSIVRPQVAESEFLTSAPKVAGRAELYVTDDFRTHSETSTDVMDLKNWQFDLGPVAVDAFKYALGCRFEKVEVKVSAPTFPLAVGNANDLIVAVEPAFADFNSHTPYFFKFETYTVKVSFKVKASDRTGNTLLERVYTGEGQKRGAIGMASAGLDANPVAAGLAVKDAVNRAVADILAATKK